MDQKLHDFYDGTINYHLSGMFVLDKQFISLDNKFKKQYNVPLCSSVYGGQNCRWHCGRIIKDTVPYDSSFQNNLNRIKELYNNNNIACGYVFSSPDITWKDLDDEKSNQMIEVISQSSKVQNYVILSSDVLREYVKDNYPKLKIVCSLIKTSLLFHKGEETPDYYNKMCDEYDMVVLRPDHNVNVSYLKKLKYKDKIEILMDEKCVYQCKLRGMHYLLMNRYCKTLDRKYITSLNAMCRKCSKNHINKICLNCISSDIALYKQLGFKHFKFTGRDMSFINWEKMHHEYYFETPKEF